MNIVNKILVIFLLVIFLLSSTGIFLIFHKCNSCEISEVLINDEKHEHDHERHHSEHESCCKGQFYGTDIKKDTDCCSDNSFFFKITEPYTYSINKIEFQVFSLTLINFFTYFKNCFQFTENLKQIIKPSNLFGVNLLHSICILRL